MLAQQISAQSVDMEQLKPALPDFRLRIAAGRDNILNSFLRARNISFGKLAVEGDNCDSLPCRSICAPNGWPTEASSSTP